MGHRTTDWSPRGARDAAPTDHARRTVLDAQGKEHMETLGLRLAGNGLRPARVVASEWRRGRQTVTHLHGGYRAIDPDRADVLPVGISADAKLLPSERGAWSVIAQRRILDWTGWSGAGPAAGPPLVVTHRTGIGEPTQVDVHDGAIPVLGPRLTASPSTRSTASSPTVGRRARHRRT